MAMPMAAPVPPSPLLPSCTDSYWHYNVGDELFSRKVFIGGLPSDCSEECLHCVFGEFGRCEIDWPRAGPVPPGGSGGGGGSAPVPRGYCFVLYDSEPSVRRLVDSCHVDNDKYYVLLNTLTGNGCKPVQVRPWRLADAEYIVDPMQTVDPRHCVFIGGLPRPVKAVEVANIVDQVFGGVCYVGIDTDPEHKYPKGAARVAFCYQASYLSAISGRYVTLSSGETPKRVEIKPYVVEDVQCDECHGAWCDRRSATIFCPDLHCLQYYCEHCWQMMHSTDELDNAYRANHTPMYIRPDHYNQNQRRGSRGPQYCSSGNGQQAAHNPYAYGNGSSGAAAQQQEKAAWSSSMRVVGRPSPTAFGQHRGAMPGAQWPVAQPQQHKSAAHALAMPLPQHSTVQMDQWALRWGAASAAEQQAAVAQAQQQQRHGADNEAMLPQHFPVANAQQQHSGNNYAGGVYAMGGGQLAQSTLASNAQMEALSQMFASMQQSGGQQQAALASTPKTHGHGGAEYNGAHWPHGGNP